MIYTCRRDRRRRFLIWGNGYEYSCVFYCHGVLRAGFFLYGGGRSLGASGCYREGNRYGGGCDLCRLGNWLRSEGNHAVGCGSCGMEKPGRGAFFCYLRHGVSTVGGHRRGLVPPGGGRDLGHRGIGPLCLYFSLVAALDAREAGHQPLDSGMAADSHFTADDSCGRQQFEAVRISGADLAQPEHRSGPRHGRRHVLLKRSRLR